MTKTFTQNDLIRFIYQETTEEETKKINQGLTQNPELKRQYNTLLLSISSLDKASLEPPARAIENILRYTHSLEVKH